MSKRESAKITSDEFKIVLGLNEEIDEESGIWEEVNRETVYADLEKGYEEIEIILKRLTDDKYFKFTYTDSPYHDVGSYRLGVNFPLDGKEVFPKTIETIIYE